MPMHDMGSLRKGEGILLCSDGFRRKVSKQELCDVMCFDATDFREPAGEEQITRRLKEIGEVCMRRGETDNLSAVYVRCAK